MEEMNSLETPSIAVSESADNVVVAAGPVEEPTIEKKQRAPKKKRVTGDFLKVESQIKKRDQIKSALKSFLPIVKQAKARNANESDTSNIVHKFFQDVLGWDFLDITSEYKVKSTYCDLAVKVDGDICCCSK